MKKGFIFIAILSLFSCANETRTTDNGQSNHVIRRSNKAKAIDDFGEHIFKLIKADNYNEILELMPDLIEYKSLINNSSYSDDKKENILNGLETELKSNIESLKNSYSNFKKDKEKSGIDWTNTKLEYIDYNHVKNNKIEKADIFLNFSFKGVNYKIELKKCIKIGGTWLIGNQINWKNANTRYYDSYHNYNNYGNDW
jgi:hypothetical protein